MSGPKRHHHLAQAIQRNFLEPGANKLWWYSRAADKYEQRTTYAIAHARHTYTFSAVQGQDRYALETAFSILEGKAAPVFKKLELGESIAQDERNTVSEFVGYQFIRTPSKIALLSGILNAGGAKTVEVMADEIEKMTPEEFTAYLAESQKKSGREWSFDQAELVESLRHRPPRVTATKEGALDSMVKLGTDIAIEYSNRAWVVLHASKERSFITSDEGVFLAPDATVDRRAFGPMSPGVSTVFPFSRRDALIIGGTGPRTIEHADAGAAAVREVNDALSAVSSEVYSHSRELLEAVVKRNRLASTSFKVEVNDQAVGAVIAEALRPKKRFDS